MDKQQERNRLIVVLNDGETFTALRGCKIMKLTDEGMQHLDRVGDITALYTEANEEGFSFLDTKYVSEVENL